MLETSLSNMTTLMAILKFDRAFYFIKDSEAMSKFT